MSADLALHVWFLVSGAIVVAISDDAFFSTLTDVNAKYARTYMNVYVWKVVWHGRKIWTKNWEVGLDHMSPCRHLNYAHAFVQIANVCR